ncbi:hypothetical protein D3C87_125120 [compost metagenome]
MKTDNKTADEAFKLNAVMSLLALKPRIDQWELNHKPGTRPPVIQDKAGVYHWMSRQQRRMKGTK